MSTHIRCRDHGVETVVTPSAPMHEWCDLCRSWLRPATQSIAYIFLYYYIIFRSLLGGCSWRSPLCPPIKICARHQMRSNVRRHHATTLMRHSLNVSKTTMVVHMAARGRPLRVVEVLRHCFAWLGAAFHYDIMEDIAILPTNQALRTPETSRASK